MLSEINQIFLFEALDDTNKLVLAKHLKTKKRYAEGETLMSAGDRDTDVFFVLKGTVRLSMLSDNGCLISYRDIPSYDYFGWLSALDGQPRLTDAIAVSEVEVIKLPAHHFKMFLQLCPAVGQTFFERVGGVIRRYTVRIEELTTRSARQRILNEIIRRSANPDRKLDVESHESFASWTGTTRETVTRTLLSLEKGGFIEKVSTGYRLLRQLETEDVFLTL